MVKYDYVKVPGSSFNSTRQAWQIRQAHEQAKVSFTICEIYDLEMTKIICDFLNKRAEVLDKKLQEERERRARQT